MMRLKASELIVRLVRRGGVSPVCQVLLTRLTLGPGPGRMGGACERLGDTKPSQYMHKPNTKLTQKKVKGFGVNGDMIQTHTHTPVFCLLGFVSEGTSFAGMSSFS